MARAFGSFSFVKAASPFASVIVSAVSPGPPVAVEPGQQGPSSNLAVGNGVVAWIVGYADANNVAESELVVWNTAQTVGGVIGDQRHLDWVVIEDGSLVWRDYLSLPDTHAVPISAIPVIP